MNCELREKATLSRQKTMGVWRRRRGLYFAWRATLEKGT